MQVRLYFDSGIVHDANFRREFVRRERDGSEVFEPYFFGTRVAHDHGRWYVALEDFMEALSVSLLGFVREVSCHDQFALKPRRTCGVYRDCDAQAEVDVTSDHTAHQIKVRGKTREAVRSLYGKIRAGSIQPVEFWDTEGWHVSRDAADKQTRPSIGDFLKAKGFLSDAALETALAAKESGQDLGDILVNLGYVTEEDLCRTWAELAGLPWVDLDGIRVADDVIKSVSPGIAGEYLIVPIQRKKRVFVIASARPLDFAAIDNLVFVLNTQIEVVLATKSAIARALAKYYGLEPEESEVASAAAPVAADAQPTPDDSALPSFVNLCCYALAGVKPEAIRFKRDGNVLYVDGIFPFGEREILRLSGQKASNLVEDAKGLALDLNADWHESQSGTASITVGGVRHRISVDAHASHGKEIVTLSIENDSEASGTPAV